MKTQKSSMVSLMAATALMLAGCGNSQQDHWVTGQTGSPQVQTGTLALRQATTHPEADTLGLTFLDAAGAEVGYSEAVIEGTEASAKAVLAQGGGGVDTSVPNVPLSTRSVKIDHLRNGGYALADETEEVTWNGTTGTSTDTSVPTEVDGDTSRWKGSVDDTGRAHLTVQQGGATAQEFLLKGVAYSPAPIGYNTRQGLDLGDFFWDSPAPQYFIDWQKMWERDIENMRKMGFNTIRVYNMIPYHFRQLNPNDPPIAGIPDPSTVPNNVDYVYEHKKFLDACWNNGKDPIYVIVGISMPDEVWYKQINDNKATDTFIAAVIKFWEAAFPKVVEQTADHPAVMGYTMFNEKAFPQYFADTGGATAEFWWGQVKRFSEQAKTLAPDKLVGWATNDDPSLPQRARGFLASHGQALDFFGVNGYQTSYWRDSLDVYKKEALGALARPVILTEFGIPNTTRTNRTNFQPYLEPAFTALKNRIAALFGVDASQITTGGADVNLTFPTEASANSIVNNDPQVLAGSAEIVGRMTKGAFEHPICVGQTYFDWSDEWWKQESYASVQIPDTTSPDPNAKRTVYGVELSPFKQEGGQPLDRFPGGYWDEEGFGLHSVAVNPQRTPQQVFTPNSREAGANTRPDILTPRQPVVDALLGAYKDAEASRNAALGQ